MSVSIYPSVCLCVCLCPRSYLRNYTSDLHQFFVHITYGRGSVLLWQRSDMLCISGFMDDVMFAHKAWLLDIAAQLKSLAINCAQQYQLQTSGRMILLFGRLK